MVLKVPDLQFPNETSIEGLYSCVLIQKSPNKFDIVFPEYRTNGQIYNIIRSVKVVEFDWQQGTFTELGSYMLPSDIGLNVPQLFKNGVGYDLDNDRILLVLGEWNGSSLAPVTSNAKIIAVNRSLDAHEVLIDDLLSLVKQAVPDADELRENASCFIVNGLGAIVAGVRSGGAERAWHAVSTDGGSTWESRHSNDRYDYQHEGLEPFWDGDTFMGFLATGHGTNSLWIKTDGSYEANSPGGSFTTVPIYDMLNNEVIWTETGSATGAIQHIWYAPPSSPFNATDVTPTGTITDDEGNTIDLSLVWKMRPHIVMVGGIGYLAFIGCCQGGLGPSDYRVICTQLPVRSGNTYELLRYSGGDVIPLVPAGAIFIRAFDLSSKKPLPSPIYNIGAS